MQRIRSEQIEQALTVLRQDGATLVFPTDTVYGIGCRTDDEKAMEEIYRLKNRPVDRPLQILLSDPSLAGRYAAEISSSGRALIERFWPGAVTLLFKSLPGLAAPLVSAAGTVGLRVPNQADLQRLIEALGGALAATSANRSGDQSPLTLESVPKRVKEGVRFVLDGGPLPPSPHSTVVDCTGPRPRLVRPGAISRREIEGFGLVE